MAGLELSVDATWNIRKEDLTFEPGPQNSLGGGSFGEVFVAKWLGNKVAAKVIHKRVWCEVSDASVAKKESERFRNEFFLLSQVHHPHIVALFGIYTPGDQPDECPVIIMELLDRNLRKLIVTGPRLCLLEVIDYSLQISSALCYLHGQTPPIIHRDLSTNNIMLTSNGVCKIVDLGLAKLLDEAARRNLTSRPGNACYMPVEVLSGIGEYDERLDVFSLNIIMLEMCNGRMSKPSTVLLEKLPGGTYSVIGECKRRETDLSYLHDSHPLKQLIVSLLQPQSSLPPVTEVRERLYSLSLSDEVARRSREEVHTMRHHFAEEEEVTRREINELRETVSDGQQVQGAFRTTSGRVDHLQESVVGTSEKVDKVILRMELTLRRMEERLAYIEESLVKTNAKVEEVSDRQGYMLKSLKRMEETSNDINSKLTAAKKKVEEVTENQLLKCGKACAASRCQGKCAKPVYQLHDEEECSCEKEGCTEYCSLCDPEEANVCCSRIHLHKCDALRGESHDCGQEHRCKESCNERGICALTPFVREATKAGYRQVGINGWKLRCNMLCPVGKIKHSGSHSCGKDHTCDRSCPLCGYYCQRQKGHPGQCEGSHGPSKRATIINVQGKQMKVDTMLPCEKLCQAAGRGHTHIVRCTCKRERTSKGVTTLTAQSGRKHKGDNSNNEDIATHSEFWNSLRPSFRDPAARSEKILFDLCGVTCSVCESRGIKTFCTQAVMHSKCGYKDTGYRENGHTFPDSCEEHRCNKRCGRNRLLMGRACERRCDRCKDHSGECDCTGAHWL